MKPLSIIKSSNISGLHWLLAFLFLGLLFYFNYFLPRNEFLQLVALYGGMFLIYLFLLRNKQVEYEHYFIWIIGLGIVARFLILFSLPNLSDDYFRFIWDAKMISQGVNPFDFTPAEYLQSLNGDFNSLKYDYDHLNSQNYYSVYPPVSQLVFFVSHSLSPDVKEFSVLIMKLIMFSFELITLRILWLLGQQKELSKNAIIWYAINPLIIIEFCGNLHFEGLMIAFLLASTYMLTKNKLVYSAMLLAGAVLTKLHPLMILPFFIKFLGLKKGVLFAIIVVITVSLGFLPYMLSEEGFALYRLDNIFESLSLYYQSFEFNASFYYVSRWIGFYFSEYHPIAIIGKILLALNVFCLLLLLFAQKKSLKSLISVITIAYLIYNLLATTVHPWYILVILPFALLWRMKTPIVWTAVIIVSYFAYSTYNWHENFYLLTLEYTCIFAFLIYELKLTGKEYELAIIKSNT